jgi:hypothetical protein
MTAFLSDVRSINDAVQRNINGRNSGVYCVDQGGEIWRVVRARMRQSELQVRVLNSGKWIVPLVVYVL